MSNTNTYIKIGKPRIEYLDNGYTRLVADIIWPIDGKMTEDFFFYEVENKWAKYFITERSDAFVLTLLTLAMEKNLDIYYETPMSEDLKYQIETYIIKILSDEIETFHRIKIIGETTSQKIETEKKVGTGFSGGVDSFYTVLSHMNSEYPSKKITHLLLAVNGAALTGFSEKLDQIWYEKELKKFCPVAEEMKLQLIGVNSNVPKINTYKTLQKGGDIFVTSAFVHALGKLFGTYYWAGAEKAYVKQTENADGRIDAPLAVSLVGTDSLKFYLSGSEVSRVEKVEYIADYPVVQKHLTVCGENKNCGVCFKCLRTQAELYTVGKLDKFSAAFPDVESYKIHFTTKLARELALDHPPYTTDIVRNMKQRNIKIPFSVYFKKLFIFSPYYFLKSKLRRNQFFMKIWYDYGWKEKLGEGAVNHDIADARKTGLGK